MSASISVLGTVVTFTGEAGERAIAQSQVTTAAPTDPVSFSFATAGRILKLRVGTASDGEDIVQTVTYPPGDHVVTFTPGVSPYFVQFFLEGVGSATLSDFVRLAPGVLELPSPWTADQIPSLRYDQSFNTMWLTGGGAEMHVIERRGASSWSIRPFLQLDGPFAALNLGPLTLTPSAQTGIITIEASGPLFATYDVGSLLKLVHPGQFVTADLSAIDDVTDPIEVTGVDSMRQFLQSLSGTWSGTVVMERSIGNTVNWQTVASYTSNVSTYYEDDLDNQVAYYRWRMTAYTSGAAVAALTYSAGVTEGIVKIVTVTLDNEITADVISPVGALTATSLWAFGEWSGRYGHPEAVSLFDGRLWAARKNAYWGSASDNFGSFAVGPLANDAIGRTFGGRMASIRWLLGGPRLLAGLSGFESEIGSNSFDEVLKPENVRARNKTTKGSADAAPALVDEAGLFINRSRQRIYRYGYSNQVGDMATLDLTRMHREIASTLGFVEVSWQQEPEPRLWAARGDGEVGVLVFDIDEGVIAWCRLVMDGEVESVCCLPTSGAEDEVYFTVKRVVDGDDVRHVEKLAPEAWETMTEAWRLHDAILYDGAADSTFSGLDHLEGRTDVYVWADGQQAGPFTVTSGEIDIGFEAEYVIAGLLYEGRYKSGRLAWGARMGAGLTAFKQLEKLGLVLHETAGGALKWGSDFADMESLDDRIDDGTLVFDAAVQAWSGDFEFSVHGWTERDTRLCISMPTAGPATVLALAETLKVNG